MSRPDGINILDGKFYLEDPGYACQTGVLSPIGKTMEHLNEFSDRNYPRTAHELFNLRHSSIRLAVEMTLEAPKKRFKILDQITYHPYRIRLSLFLYIASFTTRSYNGL